MLRRNAAVLVLTSLLTVVAAACGAEREAPSQPATPAAAAAAPGAGAEAAPASGAELAPQAAERASAGLQASPADEAVAQVRTVRVRRGAIVQRLSAPGSIVALRESSIGVEVAGRIAKVFVEEGDRVEAGAPLFEIDPQPYQMALRSAEAGLELARAERKQMEVDLGRAQALRTREVVAEREIDRLQTSLEVARARERQANEAVALARHDLDRTRVVAPYASSIAERLVDEGTMALVQPQTIVLVIQETHELEARATIPESHLQAVRVGDPALVHVEGLADPIQVEVAAVGDVIDPATRTYRVTMRVPNPDHRLKAGVFARVEILPQAKSDVVIVPREAVHTEDGRTRVFGVQGGRLVALPVRLGIVAEDVAEVLAGVREDDQIVVGETARDLAPGMRVEVTDGAGGPAS